MKKHFLNPTSTLLILFLFLQSVLQAQVFDWVQTVGSPEQELNSRMQLKANGDIFIFGNTTGTMVQNGLVIDTMELFSLKFNSNGILQNASKSYGRANLHALTLDNAGDILISGKANLNTMIGGTFISYFRNFFVKVDASNNFIDATNFAGCFSAQFEYIVGIITRDSGQFFIGGYGEGAAANRGLNNMMKGVDYALVTLIDTSLNHSSIMCSTCSPYGSRLLHMIKNSANEIFISGNCLLGNHSIIKTDNQFQNVNSNNAVGNVLSLTPGQSQNINFIGNMAPGITNFGNDTIIIFSNSSNKFYGQFDSNLNPLWAKNISSHGLNMHPVKMIEGADGSFYIAGSFTNYFTANGNTYNSTGGADIFILKTDSAGNTLWATKAGGLHHDYVNDIFVDNNNNLFISGIFGYEISGTSGGICSFDNLIVTSNGKSDIYFAKLNQIPTALNETISANDFIIANPVKDFIDIKNTSRKKIKAAFIYDVAGNAVLKKIFKLNPETKIDVSNLASGMYVIKLITDAGSINKKLIKL